MITLSQFALSNPDRYHTDKFGPNPHTTYKHGYGPFYDRIFDAAKRDDLISIAEIGVFRGGSLRLWRDWFNNADIIGLDLDTSSLPDIDGVELAQVKTAYELSVWDSLGRFSVIIDDGSHVKEHQAFCLTALRKYVLPGGWIIVEDIQPYAFSAISKLPGVEIFQGEYGGDDVIAYWRNAQ
jgi:hypothetical protein